MHDNTVKYGQCALCAIDAAAMVMGVYSVE